MLSCNLDWLMQQSDLLGAELGTGMPGWAPAPCTALGHLMHQQICSSKHYTYL